MGPAELVSIGAALIAGWSVIVAHRANGRATEANRLAGEANGIANESLEAQQKSLPPVWSAVGDDKSAPAFRNQSGRNVVVERLQIEPGVTAGYVSLRTALPTRVEYGDTFEFSVQRMMGPNPALARIHWRFEDETEVQATERYL